MQGLLAYEGAALNYTTMHVLHADRLNTVHGVLACQCAADCLHAVTA